MKPILVLFAHPAYEKSRINRRLVEAVRDLEGVTFHDLYEAYPDFQVNVAREQALLLEHEGIVFQHPFYWYSCPSLLKEWEDLVLQPGFAYGKGGEALRGKWLLSAVTTGGGSAAYGSEGINGHPVEDFLLPFRRTAVLCGMTYHPPFVVQGTHRLATEADIAPHAEAYRSLLSGLGGNGTRAPNAAPGPDAALAPDAGGAGRGETP